LDSSLTDPNPSIKRKRIHLFIVILLCGFGLSLLVNTIWEGYVLKLGYPFDTFLFDPESIFQDFKLPFQIATDPYSPLRDPADLTSDPLTAPSIVDGKHWNLNRRGYVYFPFAYWIVLPFRIFILQGIGLIVFWLISCVIFVTIIFNKIRKDSDVLHAVICCFCSYPFLFLLNRSNFEFFVFVFSYIFIHFYKRKPWLSIISLAFAIAMKLLPIGYILLLMRDRRYKQATMSLGLAGLLNIFGYELYPGGLIRNISTHLENLRISSIFYVLDGRDIAFNSNIASGIKYLLVLLVPTQNLENINLQASGAINITIIALTVFICIWSLFIEQEFWKKTLIITCGILLIPSSSADYRLILFYIPFFLWLESPRHSRNFDTVYCVLFGLLFIPKSYFHLSAFPQVSGSVLFNPVLMLIFIVAISVENLRQVNFHETRENALKIYSAYKYLIAVFLCSVLVIGLFISNINASREEPIPDNLGTIAIFKSFGARAEIASDYESAIGYYSQWIVLEPQNPEPRLGMAQAQLMNTGYWESYEEYKKVLFMPNLTVGQKIISQKGIQDAFFNVYCAMQIKHRFEWAHLLQDEYLTLGQNLMQSSPVRCPSQ
jgi:hypothetical protein